MRKFIPLLLSLSAVSACGGGGGMTNDPPSLTNSQRATLLSNTADDTFDNFIVGQDVTLRADLPLGASVQYSGALLAFGGEGTSEDGEVLVGYLGELELEADFDLGTISGEATNFIVIENADAFQEGDADPVAGGDVTGILTIASTQSVDTQAIYDITATGNLIADDGFSNLGFDEMDGSATVFGANADALNVFGERNDIMFNGIDGFVGFGGVAKR